MEILPFSDLNEIMVYAVEGEKGGWEERLTASDLRVPEYIFL